MANSSGRLYETEEDIRRQREIVEDAYAGRECHIQKTEDKDRTDFLVTGATFLHRVEVKARYGKYTLAFMEKEGYDISKAKIDALIDCARFEGSTPILIVQTADRYLMGIVASKISEVAQLTTMKRENREGEYREVAWRIQPRDMNVWPQDIIREYPPGAWNVWTDYAALDEVIVDDR